MVSRQPTAGFSVVSCRFCYVGLPVLFLRKRQRTAGFLNRKSGSGLPVLLEEGITARMPWAVADLDRQMTSSRLTISRAVRSLILIAAPMVSKDGHAIIGQPLIAGSLPPKKVWGTR